MSKSSFLKDNIALVAGITLPLLLVAFFALATVIPKMFVDPPQYDLLFTVKDYRGGDNMKGASVAYEVSEGKVRARIKKEKDGGGYYDDRLFLFEHEKQSVREIKIDIPADLPEDSITVPVTELQDRNVDTSSAAPDGYAFKTDYSYRSGLMGELFIGGRSYRHQPVIVKNGAAYKIPRTDEGYYYDFQFLGWVLK